MTNNEIYFGKPSNTNYTMNKKNKIQTTQFTMQEIWMAMRGSVQKSKKEYTRKTKHKNK